MLFSIVSNVISVSRVKCQVTRIVIKNCHQNCHQQLSSTIVLKNWVPGQFGTRTIWHRGQFGTAHVDGQFGTRTIWHRTIWHRGQFGTGQFGTRTIWHRGQFGTADNLAPRTIWHRGQFGTGQFGTRTIWHRGQFGTMEISSSICLFPSPAPSNCHISSKCWQNISNTSTNNQLTHGPQSA